MHNLKNFWINLRSSFWFTPSIIVLFSIAVAAMLIKAESPGQDYFLAQWPRLFGVEAEGARAMMSTIANSMMSVVGVTFSMILVVLTLASSQYTSRILRNFMRSRVTQVVLGIFAGIYTYSLIVLRTIRSGDELAFVPNLAVFFGFAMALGGVATLMFFIHHIASSIQASSIIASVAEETLVVIERLFPETDEEGPAEEDDDQRPPSHEKRSWCAVPASRSGYIQSVDNATLMRLACKNNTSISMESGIGEFVVENTTLASFALDEEPDEETIATLQAAVSVSCFRTVELDVAFGIRQIVDVALKALSPGINDTTTAILCIDYLTVILVRVAPRHIPSWRLYDQNKLRVIAKGPTFESLLAESFDQIRSDARENVTIMLQILSALQTIATQTTKPIRQRVLRYHVQRIAEMAERNLESAHDRARIETYVARAHEALETQPTVQTGENR